MPSREFRRAQQAKKAGTVSEAIEKRHQTHPLIYVGTVVILVVVVVTFILAGPGGPVGRGGGTPGGSIIFGQYEGHDIAYTPGGYFAQQRDRLATQVRQSAQQQNTEAMAQAIWYQAFQQTAMHVAILTLGQQAGLQVSSDAVDKALLTYPGYLDENGQFSEERYQKTSPADQAATRRLYAESLLTSQIASDILTGVKTGSQESSFIISMVKPERSFEFASFPFASFPQAEVRKYGEANTLALPQDQGEQDPDQVFRGGCRADPTQNRRQDEHVRRARQDLFQGRLCRQGRRHGMALRV